MSCGGLGGFVSICMFVAVLCVCFPIFCVLCLVGLLFGLVLLPFVLFLIKNQPNQPIKQQTHMRAIITCLCAWIYWKYAACNPPLSLFQTQKMQRPSPYGYGNWRAGYGCKQNVSNIIHHPYKYKVKKDEQSFALCGWFVCKFFADNAWNFMWMNNADENFMHAKFVSLAALQTHCYFWLC